MLIECVESEFNRISRNDDIPKFPHSVEMRGWSLGRCTDSECSCQQSFKYRNVVVHKL